MTKTLLPVLVLFMGASHAPAQPSVTPLPFSAQAISADGRVVVGSQPNGGGSLTYWTRATGTVSVGSPPGLAHTTPHAVSGDGSVIAGVGESPSAYVAWVWTRATGFTTLNIPGASGAKAAAVSRDGSTVGGAAVDSSGFFHAFVWTRAEGGRWVPSGVNYATWLQALSPDGRKGCGIGSSGLGTWPMVWGSTYVWCESLGPVTGYQGAYGYAMSADLSTVVGYFASPMDAFVWNARDGMTILVSDNYATRLTAVSDDGLVAAGQRVDRIDSRNNVAVVWRRGAGLIDAHDYFAARGLNVNPTGFVGISANGRVFADASFVIDLGPCGSADFDHDGNPGTDADIEAFFSCLAGDCCPLCDSADFNYDGDAATDADIEAFFRVLAGGSC